jgi:hypothetical protein
MSRARREDWVLLSYRLPRVPSTPRSAVWRKLKRIGVAQLGDGLVALPADARTREQLEWIAEEVSDHGGEAVIWLGGPADAAAEAAVVAKMTIAVEAEFEAIAAEAASLLTADLAARTRGTTRLRRELHRVYARDYFRAPSYDKARLAVEELAATRTAKVRM